MKTGFDTRKRRVAAGTVLRHVFPVAAARDRTAQQANAA
jgi:hypothetical protein